MATFDGFPQQTFGFMRGLAQNNNKQWFRAHRSEYQAYYLAPARDLVTALGERLQKGISRSIRAEPRVNGSIARINRDIRFATDKRPYRLYLDLRFWEGLPKPTEAPGFWCRVGPTSLELGVGRLTFGPELLAGYREAVADGRRGAALVRAIRAVHKAGPYQLGEPHLKRVPIGFEGSAARARLLRYKAIHMGADLPLPEAAHSGKFIDVCFGHFRAMAPLHRWLVKLVA